VRFVFAPNAAGDGVEVRTEPPLPSVRVHGTPRLAGSDCGDWRGTLQATFANRPEGADATFGGRYPAACGERDWYVALLDHPHFVRDTFGWAWAAAGGRIDGGVRDGPAPAGAQPLATLESPPLYDVVRDINKMSNNVMARQLFLTLATTAFPPPATTAHSADAVKRWLRGRKLDFPELVLDNGSGLSRKERIAAQSLARILIAAYGSNVRADYVSSLAVAATDGTVRKRFENDAVAEQAFLKTGSLEGVRAIAGYVFAPSGRNFVVVCIVNHANAARAQAPLDVLVEWVYTTANGAAPR
jgi:D-alanyl-D-alanine carboxypeptidase/D-alanyl-D-alanine-endopeptidase (penicillin-binding protein 4)